ncbi:hypothetical protein FQN52_004977 [Onygenales sp. PD_12]|nr:hypothetical protein FQN52_004977 [Onygenales sp. PD_12]
MISKLPYFGGQFHADDWAITVAMGFGLPLGGLAVVLADAGLGKDMWNVSFIDISYILKASSIFFVQEVVYFATMNTTKVSILFFYLRIFPAPHFRVITYVVMAITVGYGIALIFAVIFQCSPVDMAWNHWDGEHTNVKCSNINLIGWVSSAINIVLDVVIIVLPTRELFRLALSTKKKIHILLMFSVGFFVTIVSIIRLKSFLQFGNSRNPTWDHVPLGYWSTIEAHTSIVCACMPAIRALLRKVSPTLFSDRTGNYGTSSGRGPAISTGVNFGGSSGGRVFSAHGGGGGLQSPISTRTSLGGKRTVGAFGESDVFPLVEREDRFAVGYGGNGGFGSFTTIQSEYKVGIAR